LLSKQANLKLDWAILKKYFEEIVRRKP
jgi:hypothetical protein